MKKLLLSAIIIISATIAHTQVPVISGGAGQTSTDDNTNNGGAATGLGCGGGGANYYGGNGGAGKFGGGGGGAAGYTAVNETGGPGGQGVLVVAFYNGATFLNAVVYNTGTSLTISAGITSVKAWAIGAGGGGAGSTNSDGTSGGGGGAGGIAYVTKTVLTGAIISYTLGTGGTGGIDANNGSSGGNTTAVVSGTTITGNGGAAGEYNNGVNAAGGLFSGGDGGSAGGDGQGAAGDEGGGGGGGTGTVIGGTQSGGNGANGADAGDVSGLFAALGSATLLPVTWVSFTAKAQNDAVLLQWVTANEQNTLNFTVQHSTDGISFSNLAVIAAAGNSQNSRSYQYIHVQPSSGNNYYRLYQADKDGKISFSVIKQIFYTKKEADFILLTNPVINGNIQVQLKVNTTIILWTADGKQVYRKALEKGMNYINVSNLTKGNYILQAGNEAKKILIQ
jgi:hypothetical protein